MKSEDFHKCPRCGESKGLTLYNRDKTRPNGHSWICKQCSRKKDREYESRRPKRIQRERKPSRNKKRNRIHSGQRNIESKYKISQDTYNKMLEQQGDRCAICGTPTSYLQRSLAVDHNHKTGLVRGLLCSACNGMLGLAKDDRWILLRGIEYLFKNDEV